MTTAPPAARKKGRRFRRTILVVIALLILIPLAAIIVFAARFDPNAYKPEIAAAVERASGRKLGLNGPLSLGVSLIPTISAADVSLANPAGFSRPNMASLATLNARIALLPLLSGRIEIRSLVLVRPDIAIEINRDGESNLSFSPPAGEAGGAPLAAPPPAGAAGAGAGKPVTIEVRAFAIKDGTLSWQDDRSGRHGVLLLRSFSASSASAGAPLRVTADANYGGLPFTLNGTSGPLARLASAGVGPAWPLALDIEAGPARVTLAGGLTDPAAARGYHFHVEAMLPALEELAPLAPGTRLPPLHGIVATADVADDGHGRPEMSDLSLTAGPSDLGALRAGLKLASLSLVAPRLGQPCKVALTGTLGAAPFDLAATLGPLAAVLPAGFAPPPPDAPWPIAARATAAGAVLSLSGTMARPVELAGANLAASVQIPDLAKLDPIAGFALPALSQISLSGQIADAESGWRQWVRLSALSLTLPQGDLAGDASISLGGARPDVTAALSAKELDLDGLRSALAAPPPAKHGGTPAAARPAALPAPAATRGGRLIPDTPLPFALLKAADADLTFDVGKLIAGGGTYGHVDGKLSLKDGKLVLAPFAADAPGGHVALTASADGAAATPPVTLTLDAPALALSPLLASFGLSSGASGTLAVRADLEGAGNSPHAIAAGLDGRVGLAMAGGSVDNRVLGEMFGSVLRTARVPQELLGNGTSEVRCLALRIDAKGGTATLGAGLLEMTRLTLTASGGFALGPETLALRAVPTLEYRNSALSLPVEIGGTFRSPKVTPQASEAGRSAAGAAGNFINPQSELGRFLSALRGGNAPAAPDCAPALALARFGAPGPAAPPQTSAPAPAQPTTAAPAKPQNPLNLLRGLFR